jgi:hypothetical protein
MSKSRKTLFIILGGFVLVCIVPVLIGVLYIPPVQRAATYGVTDKNKSALVIHNSTGEFYILSVDVKGGTADKFTDLIYNGEFKSYTLAPGAYSLTVRYSDHSSLSNLGFMEQYVDGVKLADFSVKKGRAAIFSLRGGDVRGVFYDPPVLENNSYALNPE